MTKVITQMRQASTIATGLTMTNNITTTSMGDLEARANTLNAINATNLSNMLTPGRKINFVSVSDGSVLIRRVYSSPVAIGFRDVEFAIDENGEVIQQGSYSGVVASAVALRPKSQK